MLQLVFVERVLSPGGERRELQVWVRVAGPQLMSGTDQSVSESLSAGVFPQFVCSDGR